jgi:hypothetical protein
MRSLAAIVGALTLFALGRPETRERSSSSRRHNFAVRKRAPAVLRPFKVPASATGASAVGALAAGQIAFGALAIGALAIGALAVGALAIGRLEIRKARLREVKIDSLTVRNLKVIEELDVESDSTKP